MPQKIKKKMKTPQKESWCNKPVISPETPLANSTTALQSELCFSSLVLAPFVAQLQRICLLPSHLPDVSEENIKNFS